MQGAAPDDAGAASGLVNVAHQRGGSFGVAGLATVAASFGSLSIGLIVATGLKALGRALPVPLILRPS